MFQKNNNKMICCFLSLELEVLYAWELLLFLPLHRGPGAAHFRKLVLYILYKNDNCVV